MVQNGYCCNGLRELHGNTVSSNLLVTNSPFLKGV